MLDPHQQVSSEPPQQTKNKAARKQILHLKVNWCVLALKQRLEALGEVRANEFALRFFPAPFEITVFPDGRAIIKGTSDTAVARSLYARFLG